MGIKATAEERSEIIPDAPSLNPYQFGNPVTDTAAFFGRSDILGEIVHTLTTTQQNGVILYGQRRIGKSAILQQLPHQAALDQTYTPVQFNHPTQTQNVPINAGVWLAKALVEGLDLDIPLPTKTHIQLDYIWLKNQFLPQVYDQHPHKKILCLFDQFDRSFTPENTELITYLSRLIEDEKEKLAFVFVIDQAPSRLTAYLEGRLSQLLKGLQAIYIGPLHKYDTFSLLLNLGQQSHITYNDETLAEIWKLTQGHPFITQLLGFAIFEQLQASQNKDAATVDLEACINEAVKYGQAGLDWLWGGFTAEEKLILSAIAALAGAHNQAVQDEAIGSVLHHHLLFSDEVKREEIYQRLLETKFLRQTEPHHYQFTVPFAQCWIAKTHSVEESQRALENSHPEARNFYELGRFASERGNTDEAITFHQRAIALNPYFAGPYLALTPLLQKEGKLAEAIEAAEKAHQLAPQQALPTLKDLQLELALQLLEQRKQNPDNVSTETVITHLQRVLELDSAQPEARQTLGALYLAQLQAYLESGLIEEARSILVKLGEPVALLDNPDLGARIRDMWIAYSTQITQGQAPAWTQAQEALKVLGPLDLLDATAIQAYNQITLQKAQALLDQNELCKALTSLTQALLTPLPAAALQSMLDAYSQKQTELTRWYCDKKTINALSQLAERIEDKAARTRFTELYNQWGDALLKGRFFDEAIQAYSQQKTNNAKSKVAQVALEKAVWHLSRQELAETHQAFAQTLATHSTKNLKEQIRKKLVTYIDARWQEQAWPQANEAITILEQLGLADQETRWQTKLAMDQAKVDLYQGRLNEAIRTLASFVPKAEAEIKALFMDHLQQCARRGEWRAGATALKRLTRLLNDDAEVEGWHANWLFKWAKALVVTNAAQRAIPLCRIIEASVSEEMVVVDYWDVGGDQTEANATSLHRQASDLILEILLARAHHFLEQNKLPEAQTVLEEVLAQAEPAEMIKARLKGDLLAFSQAQLRQEKWEEAQATLELLVSLELADSVIKQQLIELPLEQTLLLLKADHPTEAFYQLKQQETALEIDDHTRESLIAKAYTFSRLYAGRDQWDEAKQTLIGLERWLTSPSDELAKLLDDLFREHRDFVRSERTPAAEPLTQTEIENLVKEIKINQEGLLAAQKSKHDLTTWSSDFVDSGLALAQAYLNQDAIEDATHIFHTLLTIKDQQPNLERKVNDCLFQYGERKLDIQDWDHAQKAMETLKSLKLAAPGGKTRPDPRADGVIQRLKLISATDLLEQGQIEAAFQQLQALSEPRPLGQIKEMVIGYGQRRRRQDDWDHCLAALRRLDTLLLAENVLTRDQEVLQELVRTLELWGRSLEAEAEATPQNLEKAAELYQEALTLSQELAGSETYILGDRIIKARLKLAENALQVTEVAQHLKVVSALPERRHENGRVLQDSLCSQMTALSEAGDWQRANDLLAIFDDPSFTSAQVDEAQLTLWRIDLTVAEVDAMVKKLEANSALNRLTALENWLEQNQEEAVQDSMRWEIDLTEVEADTEKAAFEATFARITSLKTWLEQREIPPESWLGLQTTIKSLVGRCYQIWLQGKSWEAALQAIENLFTLLPHDPEVKGWKVHVLHQRGRWFQHTGDLAEAISFYNQALMIAANPAALETDLQDAQTALAFQHLKAQRWEAAEKIYRDCLNQAPNYTDQVGKIRRDFKSCSDFYLEQSPPEWDIAYQVLSYLRKLGLDNESVFQWRQLIIIQKMKAAFAQNQPETAFALLPRLEGAWPKEILQHIIKEYCQAQTSSEVDNWLAAVDALKQFASLVSDTDIFARRWIVQELLAVADLLEEQGKLSEAQIAIELAMAYNDKELLTSPAS